MTDDDRVITSLDELEAASTTPADAVSDAIASASRGTPTAIGGVDRIDLIAMELARRRALGGAARGSRIPAGHSYRSHETAVSAAALRRLRQAAKRNAGATFTCATCGDAFPLTAQHRTASGQDVCAGCAEFLDGGDV